MTSAESGSLGPGALLAGRYRLEDQLGEHDGARFWRATDTVLARSVAVHAMRGDDERAPLLMEAARVSATVTDSHLLRVLDCDDRDGVCWVVHEWGEGISLDLMLERGPLAPARAAWLAHEVAMAIASGHAQGVAHGRLNPEAVLVTSSGAVKLIGYVVDAALHPAPVSPLYGELEPHEADVLDLGGVLYAALTGRWPGVSPSSVPSAPVEADHPLRPRQVRAGVPRGLDTICERILHRERARHDTALRTAHEVASALAEVTGDTPAALDPASMHDEPTAVLSRAALAQEAQRRAAERAKEPAGPAASAAPRDGDDGGGATRPTPLLETAAAPAMEATALHREPLEGPDSLSPMQRPDDDPPPSPFEDSPERPLFSATERRVPAGARRQQEAAPARPAAAATPPPAPPPPVWPFETPPEPAPATEEHAGRGWLRTAVVIALAIAVVLAMVVAFSMGRGGGVVPGLGGGDSDDTPSAAAQPQPIELASVTDFDPEGSAPFDENPDQVANATDGDPATAWNTQTYFNRSDLGGLKSGVGLMLDLGTEQEVGELQVRFASTPTSFEVYAAPSGATQAPTAPDQMDLVGTVEGAGERASVELDPAPTTRFVLLWLTDLPPTEGGFRGEVAEVGLRS